MNVPLPEAFGLYCGVRLTPADTQEFWGLLYHLSGPNQKCDIYTADQLRQHEARVREQVAGEIAETVKNAERYLWLRRNPQWLGWDSDFRPDEVEREVDAAMRDEAIRTAASSVALGTTPTKEKT